MEQEGRKYFGSILHGATASYDNYVLYFDELHATGHQVVLKLSYLPHYDCKRVSRVKQQGRVMHKRKLPRQCICVKMLILSQSHTLTS